MGLNMELITAFIVLVVGTSIGFFAAKWMFARDKVSKAEYDFACSEKQVALKRGEEYQSENSDLKRKIESLTADVMQQREQVATLTAEKAGFNEKLQQHKIDLENMETKFQALFENLATKIFDTNTDKFKKDSQERLSQLLTPFEQQIKEFKEQVGKSFGEHSREQFSLKKEIERIVMVNERMTEGTENLTKALKGDSKVQGDWGEMLLEKILDDAGLRKDEDYILQAVDMGLTNAEGGRIKPDAIVNLPEKKHIIIDSKVSLTHYVRYCNEADAAAQQLHLKNYLASVRNHVCELEKKQYQNAAKLDAPDFVLMFVPTEGAYFLAIQQDRELHGYAWNKKIVFVCPSTLFATMRTVASVWRLERLNKYSEEIARQGGGLYDKIVSFVGDMKKIGQQLQTTDRIYNEAMNKLTTGSGNIIRRTEKLKEYGAKTTKQMPEEFAGVEEIAGDAEIIPIESAHTG